MRRRRFWLLLALVPATLGAATAAFLWNGSGLSGEAGVSTPNMLQEDQEGELNPSPGNSSAVTGEGLKAPSPGTAAQPNNSQPNGESAPGAQGSGPAHVESGEIVGVPLLASADTTLSAAMQSSAGPSDSLSDSQLKVAGIGTPGSARHGGDSFAAAGVGRFSGAGSAGSPAVRPGKGAPQADSHDPISPGDADTNANDPDTSPDTSDPSSPGPTLTGPVGSGPANGPDGDTGGPTPPDDGSDPLGESSDPAEHESAPPPLKVPEPASLGLMLVGLLGCAAFRRKR